MQPDTVVSLAGELKNKIATRSAKVGVIGLGYVGLPLALLLTEETFRVTGFDIDPRKVKTLGEGGTYIFRIPAEQIQQASRSGFRATSEYARIAEMDAVIICVPTPLSKTKDPDLSMVVSAAKAIAAKATA